MVVGWRRPVHGNAEGIKICPLDLFFSADQVDGTQHLLQLPPGALNNSPGDPDLSQDEVIDYGHHDNLQLSALQEYLSLIDNEDSEGEMWGAGMESLLISNFIKTANHRNLYGFTLDTPLKLHPFTLNSDQDILSPHYVNTTSSRWVMRI